MTSDMWDDRYRGSELMWSAGPNMFLPPLASSLRRGSALDIACGEGRNAIWLAQNGWDVTAADFSPVGIDKGRQLAGDVEIDWVVADATTYQPVRSFDLVAIFYLHLPIDQMEQVFENAVAAVAPGGTLFAVGHAVRNLTEGHGGPPYPDILWSTDLLRPMLGDLTVVELAEKERPVPSASAIAIDVIAQATRSDT